MINKVILIGYSGSDPEIRHLDGGVAVTRVSVATTESWKDQAGEWQNKTEWHNVIAWRDLAEKAGKQIKKGSRVYVEGKLSTRKYTGQDGVERYATDVIASTIRLLEKQEGTENRFPQEAPPEQGQARTNTQEPPPNTGNDEQLPF